MNGTSFIDVLELFEADPETHAVVLVGEIGGTAEEDSIPFIKRMGKPVIAYVVGVSAPPGRPWVMPAPLYRWVAVQPLKKYRHLKKQELLLQRAHRILCGM